VMVAGSFRCFEVRKGAVLIKILEKIFLQN
jgi:hypothetical protein